MNYYLEGLQRYFDFGGRATRTQFWMFVLFHIGILLAVSTIDNLLGLDDATGSRIFLRLYILASLIPGIAIAIRRLHDTNRSGWWLLISLVPVIGGIWLLILYIQDSYPTDNQYGPNPKAPTAAIPVPSAPPIDSQPPPTI